jgi:PhzF family phenazine biosynthesis protein
VRIDTPAGFAEALGAEPLEVWRAAHLLAILANETTVRNLKPNLAKVEQICVGEGCERGNALVSAVADTGSGYDVVSRFFAPGSGIPEDPATGSAHCIIAALFCEKLGRPKLKCHQAYPGRGGDLDVELKGDRVALSGRAVTMIASRLRL